MPGGPVADEPSGGVVVVSLFLGFQRVQMAMDNTEKRIRLQGRLHVGSTR